MNAFRIRRCLPVFAVVLLAGLAAPAPALALSASHQCSFCHSLHTAPGSGLLNQANAADHVLTVEEVCLACHGPLGLATEVEVHNAATTDFRRISCRECHDPHDDQRNAGGGDNLKLVGFVRDPADLGSSFAVASIRRIDAANPSHSDPATVVEVSYENAGPALWDFAVGASDRHVCEVCHGTVDFASHRGQDRRGTDCRQCHRHSQGFN